MTKNQLVLIRHGESEWNQLNKFTGWYDCKLSKNGEKESENAAILLKNKGFYFDFAYTSMLKRAIHTLWNILKILDQSWIPVKKSWKLNERHYGALQGLNKLDTINKYGEKKVQLWRRSFKIKPPKLLKLDNQFSGYDSRYKKIKKEGFPNSESLKDTIDRVIPYWKECIFPKLKNNKKVILVAHGNSLRALIKYLDEINDDDIIKLNIPTGKPIVYEFNKDYQTIGHYYLD